MKRSASKYSASYEHFPFKCVTCVFIFCSNLEVGITMATNQHTQHCLDLTTSEPQDGGPNQHSLVGKIISDKVINFTAINAILSSSWNLRPNLHISALDRNIISCTFTYPQYMERILEADPWAVKGVVLNLLKWPPHLNLEEVASISASFGPKSITYPSTR